MVRFCKDLNSFNVRYEDLLFQSDIEDEDEDKRGDVVVIFKNKRR